MPRSTHAVSEHENGCLLVDHSELGLKFIGAGQSRRAGEDVLTRAQWIASGGRLRERSAAMPWGRRTRS